MGLNNKIAKVCFNIINLLFVVIVTYFLFINIFYVNYMANEINAQIIKNPSFKVILLVLGLLILLFIIYKIINNLKGRSLKILSLILFMMSMIFSFMVVSSFNTAPTSDQIAMIYSVYDAVFDNPHALDIGGYINIHAHQAGLFSFLFLPVKIFLENWHNYYIFNALLIQTSLILIYFSIKKLYGIKQSIFTYILFMIFIPIYFLSFVVYGEPFLVLILALTLFIYAFNFKYGDYLYALLFGIGSMLRSNVIVLLIAFLIIKILNIINNKNYKALISCVLCILIYLIPSNLNIVYLENKYDVQIGENSIPFENWLAIGLNYSRLGEPGIFDPFGYNTFVQSGYNKEISKEKYHEKIKESLNNFKDLAYTKNFFVRKSVLTWSDPDFEVMNYVFENKHLDCVGINDISGNGPKEATYNNGLGKFVYDNFYNIRNYERGFNITIIAVGLLIAILNKQKDNLRYFLELSLIGNFLLYLLIETKPRYVIIPFMFMILIAGIYSDEIFDKIDTVKDKFLKRKLS